MRTSSRPRSTSRSRSSKRRLPELVGAHAVIWTTTPWTIPVNQAIAYGPDVDYVLVDLVAGHRRFLVAAALRYRRLHGPNRLRCGFLWQASDAKPVSCPDGSSGKVRAPTSPAPSPATRCTISAGFFAKPRPFLPGDFVTTDQGTGLVHMAPDHGEDDFELCKAVGIDPVFAVEGDGNYRADWLWLGGQGLGHQQQVQRARRADLLGPARRRRAARGVRRLQAQLPAFVAVEGQGHLPLHPAMVHRDGPAAADILARGPKPSRRQRWGDEGGAPTSGPILRRPAPSSRSTRSPTPASCPRRAATACDRWSRSGPTG